MITMVLYSYDKEIVLQFDDGEVYLPLHIPFGDVERCKTLDEVLTYLQEKLNVQRRKRLELREGGLLK